MNNLLLKCPHCGVVYRIIKTDRENQVILTDYNDKIKLDEDTLDANCIKCQSKIDLIDNSMITEDWIADLFFRIKG